MLKVRRCRLCGGRGRLLHAALRDRFFDVPGEWSLMSCRRCDFVWLIPAPSPEDLRRFYRNYHTHSTEQGKAPFPLVREKLRNAILATRFGYTGLANGMAARMMAKTIGWLPPVQELAGLSVMWLDGSRKGRLLDVGCGNGRFLARMRELGWEVMGVDPDEEAGKVASAAFGVPMRVGTLADADFPESSFDCVTLNHVIEHVSDPVSLLKDSLKVMKPGGRLVVVTPNVRSLGHRIFRESWQGLDPPRHLFLFSERTLRTCAERAGLQVQTLRTTARSAHGMALVSRAIRRDGRLPGGWPRSIAWIQRLEGLVLQVLESLLCAVSDAGEEILMTATRNGTVDI